MSKKQASVNAQIAASLLRTGVVIEALRLENHFDEHCLGDGWRNVMGNGRRTITIEIYDPKFDERNK